MSKCVYTCVHPVHLQVCDSMSVLTMAIGEIIYTISALALVPESRPAGIRMVEGTEQTTS